MLLLSACHREAPHSPASALPAPAAFLPDRAFEDARSFAALVPRDSGTPGAAAAAEWIRQRLVDAGAEPELDVFTDGPEGDRLTFRNVYARIEGRNPAAPIVIVGAHYDTKSGISPAFAGANDGASGVALLLELARLYAPGRPFEGTLWLAFFDGEECRREYGPEDGLHGSRRLASRLTAEGLAPSVAGVLIADMIGDCDLNITLPANSTPSLATLIFASAREEGSRSRFSLGADSVLDDHVPFLLAGMPAVDLIDFHFGSAPGANDYWHTGQDTLDKICPESLGITGRVLVRAVNALLVPRSP